MSAPTDFPEDDDDYSFTISIPMQTFHELKAALEFYADGENWIVPKYEKDKRHKVEVDGGKLAREVLGWEP